jgi:hypothetical protein
VQHEAVPQRKQKEIDAPPGRRAARLHRIEQEYERQREQKVRAAEDDRLGRPERRDVHVVQRHRDGDRVDQPAQRDAAWRRRQFFVGDDYGRSRFGHVSSLSRMRRSGRRCAAPPMSLREPCTLRYIAPTSL